ncbi:MAG: LysR family transcriptional regulator ArgP [Novosphingobium sp.]
MLDYPALAAIASVLREGSFEKAAQALGVTPSAVSQRVRGLEERLGSILIIRGQPCTATETGRALSAHFDRVQLLEADLAPVLMPPGGVGAGAAALRVAVNSDSLATWFPRAAAAFTQASGVLLDLTVDDEGHTPERLRSGEVLAVVTADPEPVQGCRTIPLGALQYAACASPDFVARYFGGGVNADTLAQAPHMRFDSRDSLQARWVREAHGIALNGPAHRIPSTHGFLDCALAGMAWGLQPLTLVRPHLEANRLEELEPRQPVSVMLYWTVVRLHASPLRALTDAVRAVAGEMLDT